MQAVIMERKSQFFTFASCFYPLFIGRGGASNDDG